MSDAFSQVQAGLPPVEPQAAPAAFAAPPVAVRPPRLWPGIVIVVLELIAVWTPGWVEAPPFTQFLCMFWGPILATAGVLVWWLFFSRIPWSGRLLGLAAFAAGFAAAGWLSPVPFMALIVYALPVVTTVWLLWLVLTAFLRWPARLAGLLVVLLLAWGSYIFIRLDGLDGSMHGNLVYRWAPTAESKFLAERAGKKAAAAPAGLKLTLSPADWPGFRGPERDGRRTGVRIAADWNQNPPKQVWKHRVGPGWGSFAVVGDALFTQEQRGAKESVVCYDAKSGDEIWAHDDDARFEEAMGGPGPRATPTFHDGKIYALGARGRLNCLDAKTGESAWPEPKDVVADSGAAIPIWGFSSSPLVVSGVVTVFAGGPGDKSVLGYDAASGQLVWSAGNGKLSYSSPHEAKLGGVDQVLVAADTGLAAFDPVKGDVLWKYDWPLNGMHRVLQPTLVGDSDVLIGSWQETRRVHVRHDKDGWATENVWTSAAIKPNFNDMVVYDGFAYGFDGNYFTCVSLEDGQKKWRTKAYGSGQALLLDEQGVLLVLAEQGAAALVRAAPEKYEEIGRFQAIEGKTWNHPVVAHGKLFVRNGEEAACYELKEAAASEGK